MDDYLLAKTLLLPCCLHQIVSRLTLQFVVRRSQVLAFKSAQDSHKLTCCADLTDTVSLVSFPAVGVLTVVLTEPGVLTKPPPSPPVPPQAGLQPAVGPPGAAVMAGHLEGDRRHLRQQRPLLLPLPQVAPLLQSLLFPHQLQLHHHPLARVRPLAQRARQRELQGAGAPHWSGEQSTLILFGLLSYIPHH